MNNPRLILFRVLGDGPITWEEVEEQTALTPQEARTYLAGELADAGRCLMYQLLFASHSCLETVCASEPVAEPPAEGPMWEEMATGPDDLMVSGAADIDSPTGESQCPDIMLLMACALDQAPPENVREVDGHCATCDDCRSQLTAYREFAHDLNVPEPPIEGSLLERMAERREFVPKRPPEREDHPAPLPEYDTGTRIDNATSISPTSLAQQPTRWPVLLNWLAAWLPDLLRATRLPEPWADDLRAWVAERLPTLGDQHLSDALAGWVADFAGTRGMTGQFTALTPAMIRSMAATRSVEDVLRQRSPDEPEWASAFREWALSQRPASAKALLALEPEGRADDNLRAFRRALYQKAQQLYQEYQDAL